MIYLMGGLALLVVAGAVWQAIATAMDRRAYTPPGKLIDVGGYRLHINCTGNTDGHTPTVVLEAGAANWSLFWSKVQPEIARTTRVCSYDRAGLGWSDLGPTPRTSRQIVSELHTLLDQAGVTGPYVLVGHSLGGYHVRLYASQFPDEVAGMVLVDAVPEDQTSYVSPKKARRFDRQFDLARLSAPFGVVRLIGTLGLSSELETFVNKLPPEVQPMQRAIYYRSQTWKVGWQEGKARAESAGQVRTIGSLGNIPLVVLTALGEIEDEKTKQLWLEKHTEMARLSSRSTHIIEERSSHYIQLDEPEMVIKAIRQVIEDSGAHAKRRN